MNLPLHYALLASADLAKLPGEVEAARKANDTEAVKSALHRIRLTCLNAIDAIQRGEAEVRLGASIEEHA